MQKKKMNLYLNKDDGENIHWSHYETFEVNEGNHTYLVRIGEENNGGQEATLRRFIPPTIISTVCFFLYFVLRGTQTIALSGPDSLTSWVLVIATVGIIINFLTTFYLGKRNEWSNFKDFHSRHLPSVLFSFLNTMIVAMTFTFSIFNTFFAEIHLSLWTATIFASILFGIIHYSSIAYLQFIDRARITRLLILFLICSIIISMIIRPEEQWSQWNVFFLENLISRMTFKPNITLIISAFSMLFIIDYFLIKVSSQFPEHRGLLGLRLLLSVLAIVLGSIGFFIVEAFPFIHEIFGISFVILTMLMMLFCHTLIPNISRGFYLSSYSLAALLGTLTYLHLISGSLLLASFELIAFFAAGSWVTILFQHLNQLAQPDPLELVIHYQSFEEQD